MLAREILPCNHVREKTKQNTTITTKIIEKGIKKRRSESVWVLNPLTECARVTLALRLPYILVNMALLFVCGIHSSIFSETSSSNTSEGRQGSDERLR